MVVFSISQHSPPLLGGGGVIRRDEALLTKLIYYLDCGRIERASTRPDLVNFSVSKFSDIKDKVIPFF